MCAFNIFKQFHQCIRDEYQKIIDSCKHNFCYAGFFFFFYFLQPTNKYRTIIGYKSIFVCLVVVFFSLLLFPTSVMHIYSFLFVILMYVKTPVQDNLYAFYRFVGIFSEEFSSGIPPSFHCVYFVISTIFSKKYV